MVKAALISLTIVITAWYLKDSGDNHSILGSVIEEKGFTDLTVNQNKYFPFNIHNNVDSNINKENKYKSYFARVMDTELNLSLFRNFIEKVKSDPSSPTDLFSKIKSFNNYLQPKHTGRYFHFKIKTKDFGDVPFKVYVPKNYNCKAKTPLIMYLHGATGQYSFDNASQNYLSDDGLLKKLENGQKYIVIVPISDQIKMFDWALYANTFKALEAQVSYIKKLLNVDDSRVYLYGHSDGGRGAFCFMAVNPTDFAGSVSYNMGPSLILDHIFLKNIINRQPYIVQTDLDKINPYQDVESAKKLLNSANGIIHYKLYKGYQHFDKHLGLDFSSSMNYLEKTKRPSLKSTVYLQSIKEPSRCDYLQILESDKTKKPKEWTQVLNFKYYNKIAKKESNDWLYSGEQGSALKSVYSNNTFTIETSRIKKFEIFLNPEQVDLNKPVIVKVNNEIVYNKKSAYDSSYMISQFEQKSDRQILFANHIILQINEK